MKKRNILIFLAVLVAANVVGWAYFGGQKDAKNRDIASPRPKAADVAGVVKYANAKGEEWTIPEGEYKFQVTSADQYPKIVTGIISPLDVKVGDTQKMLIAVNGDAGVKRVWAEIETDNSVKNVELNLTGTTTITKADRMKEPYLVDEKGYLVMNDKQDPVAFQKFVRIAEAAAPVTQSTYEGSWVVEDTHTKTYHTKFTVVDTAGRQDAYTLGWSDPTCNFDINGALQTPTCTPVAGEVIGFDGGSLSLNGNTVTLTGTGSVLAFNGGSSAGISIGAGKIGTSLNPIVNSAPVQQTNMWYVDADSDTYTSDVTMIASANLTWAGHIRVKDVSGKGTGTNYQTPAYTSQDCNDSYNTMYPTNNNWYSVREGVSSYPTSRDGVYGDFNCNGYQENAWAEAFNDFTATPYASVKFNNILCAVSDGVTTYPSPHYYYKASFYTNNNCGGELYYASGLVETGSLFYSTNGTACDGALAFLSKRPASSAVVACH